MKHTKHNQIDPSQTEFGLIWEPLALPFHLRAGDVIRYDGRLCRVVRVNECAAVDPYHDGVGTAPRAA